MKKLIIIPILLLSGCGFFAKPSAKVAFQYEIKPLDLSAYKSITITTNNQQVCMPYDDYNNQIMLFNKLSDYIEYQRTIITNMDNYYNKK